MRRKLQGTDMKKQWEDENCPESDWEAVTEAVLFTMGGSVELGQLAAAIGQSEEEIQRVIGCGLRRYTPNTITDEGALRRDLQKIRSRGYALSFEETDPGVGAVGAPIFNGQGQLLYGISIVGPVERLREKGIGSLAETLMEKCRDIMEKIAKIP